MTISKKMAAALTVAVGAALAVGVAVPAQAATGVSAHVAHAGKSNTCTNPNGRIDQLPAPTRKDEGTGTFTVNVFQYKSCRGTLNYIHFSGTGIPGHWVGVTYAKTQASPDDPKRGGIGPVEVNKNGNWRMDADFSYADITKDPATGKKRLEYHAVEFTLDPELPEQGRYQGYIIPLS